LTWKNNGVEAAAQAACVMSVSFRALVGNSTPQSSLEIVRWALWKVIGTFTLVCPRVENVFVPYCSDGVLPLHAFSVPQNRKQAGVYQEQHH